MMESFGLKWRSEDVALRIEGLEKEKLARSLQLVDAERLSLLDSIRGLEKKYETQLEKNHELGRNLNSQNERLSELEDENFELKDKIKILTAKLVEYENSYEKVVQECGNLRTSLTQLQQEYDAIRRKAENRENYIDQLASSYGEEKETILGVHQRHSRLLTSKLMFDSVLALSVRRKNWSFGLVKQFNERSKAMGKKCLSSIKKIVRNRMRYGFESVKNGVEIGKQEKIKLEFARKVCRERVLKKIMGFFNKKVKNRRSVKLDLRVGISKVKNVETKKKYLKIFRCVQQWKNAKIKDLYDVRLLKSIILGKYRKLTRIHLDYWVKINKKIKFLQAQEDLTTDLSIFSLKQSVFYEFRRIAQVSSEKKKFKLFSQKTLDSKNKLKVFNEIKKNSNSLNLKLIRLKHIFSHFQIKSSRKCFDAWRSKLLTLITQKSIVKAFKNKENVLEKSRLQKFFIGWKSFHYLSKLEKISKELLLERPRREKYECAYEELNDFNSKILMHKALTSLQKNLKGQLRSYFVSWHSRVYEYESGIRKIGRMMIRLYSNTIESKFNQWKLYREKSDLGYMIRQNDQYAKENQILVEHIDNLEICLEQLSNQKKYVSAGIMRNTMKKIIEKQLRFMVKTWNAISCNISQKFNGANQIIVVLDKYIKSCSYSSLQAFSALKKRKSVNKKKLYVFTFKKWRKINSVMIHSWLNYVRLCKHHKSKLKKILIKKYKAFIRISLVSLKDFKDFVTDSENTEKFRLLQHQMSEVQAELEETWTNLTDQTNKNRLFSESYANRVLTKGLSTLSRLQKTSLKNSLLSWKKSLKFTDFLKNCIKKMLGVNSKTVYRKVFNTWTSYKNRVLKTSGESRVNALILEKKTIRREATKLQTRLENIISEKNSEILEFASKQENLSAVIEKLGFSSIRKKNDCVTFTKAQWVFMHWKNMYINKKTVLGKLVKLIKKQKIRRSYRLIRKLSQKILYSRKMQEKFIKFLLSYRTRKLLRALELWKKNNIMLSESYQLAELEITVHQFKTLGLRYHCSKKNGISKGIKFVNDKKKLKILKLWMIAAKKIKNIKKAGKKFETNSQVLKKKMAVNNLWWNQNKLAKCKWIIARIRQKNLEILKNFVFTSWKFRIIKNKTIKKTLEKILKRVYNESLMFGLSSIKVMNAYIGTTHTWSLFAKEKIVKTLLNAYSKSDLQHFFSQWSDSTRAWLKKSKSLQKILSRTSTRIKSSLISKWRVLNCLEKTVDHTENYGKSAELARKLQKFVKLYHKLLKKEGINSLQIDLFLMESLRVKEFLILKGIKNSDFLEYTFITWKAWVIKRYKIKSCSLRMTVYKRKGELLSAFNTWKKRFSLISPNFKHLTRRQILVNTAVLEKNIGSLKGTIKEKQKKLKLFETYSKILEENVRKGQNQALANCAGYVKKSMKTCFVNWVYFVQSSTIDSYHFKLTEVQKEFEYIKRKCRDFDIENKELAIENKELIRNSYESRDLACSLRALHNEKDRLEYDLKEKYEIIKQLVQENRELAFELSSARYQ